MSQPQSSSPLVKGAVLVAAIAIVAGAVVWAQKAANPAPTTVAPSDAPGSAPASTEAPPSAPPAAVDATHKRLPTALPTGPSPTGAGGAAPKKAAATPRPVTIGGPSTEVVPAAKDIPKRKIFFSSSKAMGSPINLVPPPADASLGVRGDAQAHPKAPQQAAP